MFNGVIFNIGEVHSIKKNQKSILIGIKSNLNLKNKDIGSSICCDGVCLTLNNVKKNLSFFYISNETIKRSNFRNLKIGSKINLETSLIYGKKISGNFSQGHVDCTAKIKKIDFIDKSWILKLEIQNKNLINFRGKSIHNNQWSLFNYFLCVKKIFYSTSSSYFKTYKSKILKKNDIVNVELDIFGKYVYKYNN